MTSRAEITGGAISLRTLGTLRPSAGAGLIAAREELGLLQDVDDLTVYANIDPRRVHTVHDLIVFGPA